MKLIIIGDIHGESSFQEALNYYPERNDIKDDFSDIDLVIFMGDYVDSSYIDNISMKNNLIKIINLKKKYPDKVVLLIGNHDLQYMSISNNHPCSGYRSEMQYDFYEIFNNNKNLFQVAFQLETSSDDKYIFTHAGIHRGFYNQYIKEHFNGNLADTLNMLYPNYKPLYNVSFYRGGRDKMGGIFWADFIETYKKPLENYHQIIGHTHKKEGVKHYNNYKGKTSTTYVDCMPIWYEMNIENVLDTFQIYK